MHQCQRAISQKWVSSAFGICSFLCCFCDQFLNVGVTGRLSHRLFLIAFVWRWRIVESKKTREESCVNFWWLLNTACFLCMSCSPFAHFGSRWTSGILAVNWSHTQWECVGVCCLSPVFFWSLSQITPCSVCVHIWPIRLDNFVACCQNTNLLICNVCLGYLWGRVLGVLIANVMWYSYNGIGRCGSEQPSPKYIY